jgi:hypothetical protein
MPVFNDKNSYNKWIKRITVLYCTVLRFTKSQMKTKRNEPIAQKIEYLIPNTKAPKAKNVNKFCFHHQFYIFTGQFVTDISMLHYPTLSPSPSLFPCPD